MKHIFIILILLITVACTPKSIFPKMDTYEKQMLEEYKYHNIDSLFKYIENNDLIDKSIASINGKEYKIRVYRNSKRAEYDQNLNIIFKHKKFTYIFSKTEKGLKFSSTSLSFSIQYKPKIKEYKFVSNKTSFGSQELKIYGYVYVRIDDKLIKVEDWVVRDALGRANSMRKPKK
jgi:hypothetical protein